MQELKKVSPRVHLLPYDYTEELEKWLPLNAERPSAVIDTSETSQGAVQLRVSQQEQTSPVWLVMQDQEIIEIRQGRLLDDELCGLLNIFERP